MSSGTLRRRHSTSNVFQMMRDRPEAAAAARTMLERTRQREARLTEFVDALPRLTERDLAELEQSDSTCPVCLTSLLALLAEEEMALAMDSPAHPVEQLGVTRLVQTCGHIFCRKDIREWIFQGNTTCPTCRRPFLTLSPEEAHAAARADSVQELSSLLDTIEVEGARMDSFLLDLLEYANQQYGARAQATDSQDAIPTRSSEGAGRSSARPDGGEPGLREAQFDLDDGRSEFSGMYS